MTKIGERDFTEPRLIQSFGERGANFHITLGNIAERTKYLHELFNGLQERDRFGQTSFPLEVSDTGMFGGGQVYREEVERVGSNKSYTLGVAGKEGVVVELCSPLGYASDVTAIIRRTLTDEENNLGYPDDNPKGMDTTLVSRGVRELVAGNGRYTVGGDQAASILAITFASVHRAIVQAVEVYPSVQSVLEKRQRLGIDATARAARDIV